MRLRKNAKVDLIRGVPLFSHCSNAQLGALAAEADELDFPAGRTLTQEGDRGREFMVIVEGSATVTRNGRKVNQLGGGVAGVEMGGWPAGRHPQHRDQAEVA